jgi:glycosyltransferase involved in cell wall biosynthesis
MSKIIIYTPAYNAEKTLRRAVDSILNQTYTDFIYYLLDNASTDGTYEIVKEYARCDKRIIPLHNDKNWIGNTILDVTKNHDDDCYFCELDADDEYLPDFLEKMLDFIENKNLDIAACGSYFIDIKSNECSFNRKVDENLIIEKDGFDRYFPIYHQFMRTIWGKMYSISLLRKHKYKSYAQYGYGNDTHFTMNAFFYANRVGIISETLHRYYISSKSVSHMFDEGRIMSDQVLFEAAYDFLLLKTGRVRDENLNFLMLVYLNAIIETLNVLLNSNMSNSEKLQYLLKILQSSYSQELIKWPGAKSKKAQLFSQVASWILSKVEIRRGKELEVATDILAAMDIYPTTIVGWQDEETFTFLVKMREKQMDKGLVSYVDSQIISIVSSYPYLLGLNVDFLCYFRNIIKSILQNGETDALNQIIEIIAEGIDIPDEHIEALLRLALNLSAKLELQDYFLYFKKLLISILIDFSRINEAIEEFADWDEVLPDDIDFKNLKERLGI